MTEVGGDPHIQIEPLAPQHARGLQRIASDPRVQATTLLPEPYPLDGAAEFTVYARGVWGTEYHWAIVASGEVVGAIGIKEIHDEQGDLGYYVDPERWGEGIASAAVREACAFSFAEAGIERLTAHTLDSNAASGCVLEKAGFHQIETIRNPFAKWPPLARVSRYALQAPRSG